MQSNLTSKPDWLSYYPTDNKNTLGVDYGFDSTGMFFSGNAGGCGSVSFPIRLNYDIPSESLVTVIYTIIQDVCTDQGMCFFNTGVEPGWDFDPCNSRISVNMNCNDVEVNGRTTSEGGINLGEGGVPFTFKVVYTPANSRVITEVYEGTSTNNTLLATYTLNERLPAGPYRIGFDADADDSNTGYFTYLQIEAETTNYPLPKITFKVKTYDPSLLAGTLSPDGNLDNIIKALKEQTVWLPHVDYALKHDDTFVLYGKTALDLKNQLPQLNSGWSVVEIVPEEEV